MLTSRTALPIKSWSCKDMLKITASAIVLILWSRMRNDERIIVMIPTRLLTVKHAIQPVIATIICRISVFLTSLFFSNFIILPPCIPNHAQPPRRGVFSIAVLSMKLQMSKNSSNRKALRLPVTYSTIYSVKSNGRIRLIFCICLLILLLSFPLSR